MLAVLLTPFAIMPYFGLGADVSPNAHGHLQRRYGVVGMWLAGLWLAAMAVLIVAWIVKRLIAKRSDLVRSQRA